MGPRASARSTRGSGGRRRAGTSRIFGKIVSNKSSRCHVRGGISSRERSPFCERLWRSARDAHLTQGSEATVEALWGKSRRVEVCSHVISKAVRTTAHRRKLPSAVDVPVATRSGRKFRRLGAVGIKERGSISEGFRRRTLSRAHE